MNERIYVSYSIASATWGGGPVLGYHMIINYVDSQGVHRAIEGKPQIPFTSTTDKAAATIAELLSGPEINHDSRFGRLVGEDRFGQPIDATRPFESIAEAPTLSAEWAAILAFSSAVNANGYEYRPHAQNSNTFVTGALAAAGLPSPTQEAFDPQTGQFQNYQLLLAIFRTSVRRLGFSAATGMRI